MRRWPLEGSQGGLIANHGVIATGADLPSAISLAGEVKISRYNTVQRCPWGKSVFSMTRRCAAWSRSFALTGNRTQRIPISSLAELSQVLPKEDDHAGGRHTFHLPNPRH